MSEDANYDPVIYENYFLKKLGEEEVETVEELFQTQIFNEKRKENTERKNKLLAKKTGGGFEICPKCKNKDNSLIPMQTRSADEPVSFFIVCNICGHRWCAG